jgi:hypothetical protein
MMWAVALVGRQQQQSEAVFQLGQAMPFAVQPALRQGPLHLRSICSHRLHAAKHHHCMCNIIGGGHMAASDASIRLFPRLLQLPSVGFQGIRNIVNAQHYAYQPL